MKQIVLYLDSYLSETECPLIAFLKVKVRYRVKVCLLLGGDICIWITKVTLER